MDYIDPLTEEVSPAPEDRALEKYADETASRNGHKPATKYKRVLEVSDEGDRLPPHSEEMERGVLSCILQSPANSLNECAESIKDGEEVFYDERHKRIYALLVSMFDAKAAIDMITVQQALKDQGLLDKLGGNEYLSKLQDAAPSASNLKFYIDGLLDRWLMRRLIQKCADISAKAYDYAGEVDSILEEADRSFSTIERAESQATLDSKAAGARMIQDLGRRYDLKGALSGLDTGLIDLNKMTEGLQFGEQAIIGARPSQGKTALGLGIMMHTAFQNKIPTLFISLEMSVEAVMRRLLAMYMKIPLQIVRRGNYDDEQMKKFVIFRDHSDRAPFWVVDGVEGMGIRQLGSRVRRHVMKYGIKLVIIDYLQKIRPAERHEKRTYEIGEISGRLKALAVETSVAMITLAQLNRENVREKGRLPRLSDLADSGQIERDADLVGLIHREGKDTKLIIAKQRDGETGVVYLRFDGTYCKFESAAFD